jgi:hypothetical protein
MSQGFAKNESLKKGLKFIKIWGCGLKKEKVEKIFKDNRLT